MYHVGICDDDPVFIKYTERLFGEGITFYEYLSGEEMLQDMEKQEKYDLLVLDVALPGMDGNQTAREFRKMFPDKAEHVRHEYKNPEDKVEVILTVKKEMVSRLRTKVEEITGRGTAREIFCGVL